MDIYLLDRQKDLPIYEEAVKKLASAVVDFEKKSYDELNIHLVDRQEISHLHALYFNDPSPTDCISFPLCDEDVDTGHRHMGDLFVCPQAAKELAEGPAGAYEELSLYIVHSLLHLMGYGDVEQEERLEMRRAEKRHMTNLRERELLLKPPPRDQTEC